MKTITLFLLAASVALAQTTNYPSALDTNTSLFVTADNIQTQLSSAMAAVDTVAVVASSTGFVPNMIATVCDATTSVSGGGTRCTTWEHMLVTAVNGNVLTVTRGFAGTSARAHASSS